VANTNYLTLLNCLPDESIDAIYIDPPFNTGVVRTDLRDRAISYQDNLLPEDWICFIKDVVFHCHRVLKSYGSMYLHLDWRGVHEAKLFAMDVVFGRKNQLGEIIWSFDWGCRQKNCFAKKHDTILHYAKEKNVNRFNSDKLDRVPYKAPELQMYRAKRLGKNDGTARIAAGKPVTDVFTDINVLGTSSHERALNSYPTMKPSKLLTRLLAPVVIPGSIVLDPFCGSGTIVEAAHTLNCSFIAGDINPQAALIASRRASRLGANFFIVEC
jgi:site-specific DNA-methyltransferase (adenine-specific)